MSDEFLITSVPSIVNGAKLFALEGAGRMLRDSAGGALAAVLVGAMSDQSRAWMRELSESSAKLDPAYVADLATLQQATSFGLSPVRDGAIKGSALALLLLTNPDLACPDEPIGSAHVSVRAKRTPDGKCTATAVIWSAWILPQHRQKGYSKLLAQAMGESVAHALSRLCDPDDDSPAEISLGCKARDTSGLTFVESCADEIRLCAAARGVRIAVNLLR